MRHVRWMQSPLAAASLRSSSFDPRELRGRATLYLILPAEFITVMQPLLRIWLGNILRVVTRRGADESNPILFLIDEAAQCGGQMRALEDAVRLYRGYGIRCWFFWQAQDQMKECFGERANIIQANMDVTQYFGISDYETAEGISKRIGDATIPVVSVNETNGYSRPTVQTGPHSQPGTISESTSVTTNDTGRRLFHASEIMTLNDQVCVVFIANYPAIVASSSAGIPTGHSGVAARESKGPRPGWRIHGHAHLAGQRPVCRFRHEHAAGDCTLEPLPGLPGGSHMELRPAAVDRQRRAAPALFLALYTPAALSTFLQAVPSSAMAAATRAAMAEAV